MTATPPDPLATQHDGTLDPDSQAPVDPQTLRLREENRALRELLAAQVQAAAPRSQPGCLRRMGWWLISAPGAALVGWRALLGRDDAPPITSRRVGSATFTVLYTLAIYGALVLLVVSWNAPNNGIAGTTAASPVRVPLLPLPPIDSDDAPSDGECDTAIGPSISAPSASSPEPAQAPAPESHSPTPAANPGAGAASPNHSDTPAPRPNVADAAPATAPAIEPQSALRVTEIPAQNPLAWVDALKGELTRCAQLGFFERPDCAWAARKQFCEPNQGWGTIKECPAQP
ncbi:hypothetical protein LMG6001_01255 [Achromobacter insolitus]|uniref:hypothetical protein n=1 Tax=Achromobacter insolitus TaxID=217204 RepID=UPI0014695825|nr:hypothetical protein [Achromobacter insolitus]CAB3946651.1 hypothetical protein LMG6001_01255 [Achromobacter insolitus]